MKKVYRLGLLTALMGIFLLAGSGSLRAQYTIQTNYENGGFVNPGSQEDLKEEYTYNRWGIKTGTDYYGRYNYTGGSADLRISLSPSVNLPAGSVTVTYYDNNSPDYVMDAQVNGLPGTEASITMASLMFNDGPAKTIEGQTYYERERVNVSTGIIPQYEYRYKGNWYCLFNAKDAYTFEITVTLDGVEYKTTLNLNVCWDPGFVAAPINPRVNVDWTRVTFSWEEPENSGWHNLASGVKLSFPFRYWVVKNTTQTVGLGMTEPESLKLSPEGDVSYSNGVYSYTIDYLKPIEKGYAWEVGAKSEKEGCSRSTDRIRGSDVEPSADPSKDRNVSFAVNYVKDGVSTLLQNGGVVQEEDNLELNFTYEVVGFDHFAGDTVVYVYWSTTNTGINRNEIGTYTSATGSFGFTAPGVGTYYVGMELRAANQIGVPTIVKFTKDGGVEYNVGSEYRFVLSRGRPSIKFVPGIATGTLGHPLTLAEAMGQSYDFITKNCTLGTGDGQYFVRPFMMNVSDPDPYTTDYFKYEDEKFYPPYTLPNPPREGDVYTKDATYELTFLLYDSYGGPVWIDDRENDQVSTPPVYFVDGTIVVLDPAEAPVFEPEDGTVGYNTMEVTLTCETEGATIWYSENGVDFSEYDPNDKPIVRGQAGQTVQKTVYAKATATGYTESEVASVTYTIRSLTTVGSIAALYGYEGLAENLAAPTDDAPAYQVTGNMIITHVDNNTNTSLRRIYVQDPSNIKDQPGQHCIIMQPVPANINLSELAQGDIIRNVKGKLIKQGGILYFVPLNGAVTRQEQRNNPIWVDNFSVEDFADMAADPTQAAAYRSHVVCVPFVKFNTSASVFTANNDLPLVDAFDNSKSLTMRSNFNTDYMGSGIPKNVNYNLYGIVTLDNPAKLAPRNWADFVRSPYVDITTANTNMGIISEGTKDLVCNISYGKFAGKPTFELIKNPDGPAVRGFDITEQNLPDATAADEKTGTFTVTYTYQTTSGTDEVWVVANYAGLKDTIKLTAQSRPRAAAPVFSTDPADVAQSTPVDGPVTVYLSSTTSGNDIYYRRNSVATYTKYTDAGITLNPGSSQQTHTIYAYTAEGNGFAQSTEVTAVYIIKKEMLNAAAPTFSPATGAEATYQMTVTLSSTTPNATFKYKLGESGTVTDYDAATGIVLTNEAEDGTTEKEVTVIAVTYADGFNNSAPSSATYTLHPRPKMATPVFDPASGAKAWNELEFTLSCASEGATIEYSTDGGTSWTEYNGAVKLTESATVKAHAVKEGCITSDEATATYTVTPLTDVATIEALYAYEEDCNTDKYFRITGDITVYQADYNANSGQHPGVRVIYVQDKNGAGRSGERSLVITPAHDDDIDISGLTRGTVIKNVIGKLTKAQFGLIGFLPDAQTLQTNGTATIWADTVEADNLYYINKPGGGRKYHAGLVCVPYLQFPERTGNFVINTPVNMIDAQTGQTTKINLRPDFTELTTHAIPSSDRAYFVTGMIMFADELLRIVPRDYNDIVLAPALDITTPNQALTSIYAGTSSLEATVAYSNGGGLPFAGSTAPTLTTVKNTGGFNVGSLNTDTKKFNITYAHRGGAYKDTLWVVAKYDRLTDTLKVWAESKACNAPEVTPSTSGTNVTLNLGGTYVEYETDYSTTNGPWPTANKQTGVTAKSVQYTGLNYSTTYYYSIKGICAKNGEEISISPAAEGHFETGPQGGMSIALDDNKPSTEEITDGAVQVKYTYENISLGAGTAVQDGREGLVKITFYNEDKTEVLGSKLTTLDAYDTTFSVSGTYYVEVKLVQLDGTDWTGEGINATDIIDDRSFTVNLPDAAAPVISVVTPEPVYVIEGGVTKYYDSVQIEISCTETGAALSYSLNGTDWNPYSAPFWVKSSTTVEAKSVVSMKDNGYASLPVTVITEPVKNFIVGILPDIDRKYTTMTYTGQGGTINWSVENLRDDITITLKSKDNKAAIALGVTTIVRSTTTVNMSGSIAFTAAFTDKVPGYWEDTLIFTSGGVELLRKLVTTTITAFKVPEVVITPATPTEYTKQVEVNMTLGTVVNTAANYDIYYTLNGEVPVQEETETNFKYSAPFTLLNDTVASCSYTVKALAFERAKIDTPLVTPAAITYTLNNAAVVSAGPKTASYTIYKDSAIKDNTLAGYTVKYLPDGKKLDISVSKRAKDKAVAITVAPTVVNGEGAGKIINFDLSVAREPNLHDTGSFQDTVVIRLDGKVLYKTVVNLRVDYLSLPAMNPMLKGSEDVALGRVYTGTKDADITVTYRDLLDKRFDAVSGEKSDKGTVKYTLIGTDKAYFTLITPNAEEQQYTFSNGDEKEEAAKVRYTYQPDHLGLHKAGLEIRHTHVTKGLLKDTVWITAESRACAAPTVEKTVDSVVFATLTLNSEDALSYTYRYAESTDALATATETSLTGNILELAALKAGTTYYYQIKSHCADDVTGAYFTAKNFKTKVPVLELTRPENGTVYNKAEDAEFNFYVENIHLSAAPSPLPAKYLPYGKIKVEIFRKGEGDSYTLVDEAMEVYTTSVKKFLSSGDYKVKATLITEQPATPAGLVPDIEVEQTFKVNLPNLPLVKFTPEDGTVHYDSLQLSLACDSPNAVIYYSLDKTDWKVYDPAKQPWIKTPAGKNAMVTVYAYAKQDKCDDSDIAEAEYEIRPLTKVESAADLYAYYSELQDKEKPGFNDKYFQINGNLIVTHTDSSEAVRRRIYVQDEGGNVKEGARSLIIRILSTHKNISVKNYKRSDMLQQGIIGQMVRQDSLMRFLPIDEPIAVQSTGHDIYVDTLTLAEIKANKVKYHGDLACITYVSFNATNKEYFEPDQFYTLTCEHGETMRFRTEFKYADYLYPDPVAIPKDGAKYFITGILTQTVDGGVGRARITPRDRNDVAKAPFVDITTANTNLGYLYTGTAKVDAQFDYGNYTGELGLEFVKNTRGFALAKDIPAKTFTVTYTKQDDAGKDTAWVVATYRDRTDTLKVWAESRLCPVPVMQEPSTGPHNATLEFDGPYVRVEIDTTTVDGSWHDATKTMIVNAPNNQKSFAGLPFSTTYYYRVSGVCANEKDNTVTVNSDYAQGNFTTGDEGDMAIILDEDWPAATCEGKVHIVYDVDNIGLGADAEVEEGGNKGLVRIVIFKNDEHGDTIVKVFTKEKVFDTFLLSGRYLVSVRLVNLDSSLIVLPGKENQITKRRVINVNLPDVDAPEIVAVAPFISPKPNEYYDSVTVKITCPDNGAALWYSYNGTDWESYTEPLKLKASATVYAKSTKYRMDDAFDTLGIKIWTNPPVLHQEDGKNVYTHTDFTTLSWKADSWHETYDMTTDYLRTDMDIEVKSAEGQSSPAIKTLRNKIKKDTGYYTNWNLTVYPAEPLVGAGTYQDTVIISTQGIILDKIIVNITVHAFTAPRVVITPATNTEPGFEREVKVAMKLGTAANTAATYDIYYTLDGSVPTQEETETCFKYNDTITLVNDTVASGQYTVKALAFDRAKVDTTKEALLASATYTLWHEVEIDQEHEDETFAVIVENETFTKEIKHTAKYLTGNVNVVIRKRASDEVTALKVTPSSFTGFTGKASGDALDFTVSSVEGIAPGEYQDTVKITTTGKVLCTKVINLRVKPYKFPEVKESTHKEFYGAVENVSFRVTVEGIDSEVETIGKDYVVVATRTPDGGEAVENILGSTAALNFNAGVIPSGYHTMTFALKRVDAEGNLSDYTGKTWAGQDSAVSVLSFRIGVGIVDAPTDLACDATGYDEDLQEPYLTFAWIRGDNSGERPTEVQIMDGDGKVVFDDRIAVDEEPAVIFYIQEHLYSGTYTWRARHISDVDSSAWTDGSGFTLTVGKPEFAWFGEPLPGSSLANKGIGFMGEGFVKLKNAAIGNGIYTADVQFFVSQNGEWVEIDDEHVVITDAEAWNYSIEGYSFPVHQLSLKKDDYPAGLYRYSITLCDAYGSNIKVDGKNVQFIYEFRLIGTAGMKLNAPWYCDQYGVAAFYGTPRFELELTGKPALGEAEGQYVVTASFGGTHGEYETVITTFDEGSDSLVTVTWPVDKMTMPRASKSNMAEEFTNADNVEFKLYLMQGEGEEPMDVTPKALESAFNFRYYTEYTQPAFNVTVKTILVDEPVDGKWELIPYPLNFDWTKAYLGCNEGNLAMGMQLYSEDGTLMAEGACDDEYYAEFNVDEVEVTPGKYLMVYTAKKVEGEGDYVVWEGVEKDTAIYLIGWRPALVAPSNLRWDRNADGGVRMMWDDGVPGFYEMRFTINGDAEEGPVLADTWRDQLYAPKYEGLWQWYVRSVYGKQNYFGTWTIDSASEWVAGPEFTLGDEMLGMSFADYYGYPDNDLYPDGIIDEFASSADVKFNIALDKGGEPVTDFSEYQYLVALADLTVDESGDTMDFYLREAGNVLTFPESLVFEPEHVYNMIMFLAKKELTEEMMADDNFDIEDYTVNNMFMNSNGDPYPVPVGLQAFFTMAAEPAPEPEPVKLPSVKFSPDGGTFYDSVWVKLSHDSASASIYYRLAADAAFELYTDSIKLTELSTTVEAFAYMEGELFMNSDTVSEMFIVQKSGEETVIKLPSVSVKPEGGKFTDSVWVELACTYTAAEIRYRTSEDAAFELYKGSFKLTDTATVEAFAHVEDAMFENSDTVSYVFNVAEWVPAPEPEPVKLPSVKFAPEPGVEPFRDSVFVKLSHDSASARIYYRLASDAAFTLYTDSIKLTELSTTVEAFASMEDGLFINSDTASETYFVLKSGEETVIKLPSVSVKPEGGDFSDSVWVELACTYTAAGIYYRTSEEAAFELYKGAFKLTDTATVEAFAHMDGTMFENSDTASVLFNVKEWVAPEPVKLPSVKFSPDGGEHNYMVWVTLSCDSTAAEIYYRTSSSDAFTRYTSRFRLTETSTVEAFAHMGGEYFINSDTASVWFVVLNGDEPVKLPSVVISPDGGRFDDSVWVELGCAATNADIYYRTSAGAFGLYAGPFKLTVTTVVEAFAHMDNDNYVNSDTAEALFRLTSTREEPVKLPNVIFHPDGGRFDDSVWVELSCDNYEADIYYRVSDAGSTSAVTSFRLYTEGFWLKRDTVTVEAFAHIDAEIYLNSDTLARTFFVKDNYVEPETGLDLVKIYPNPTLGEFHVEVPDGADVDIFTVHGAYLGSEYNVSGVRTYRLRVGEYFVRVRLNGEKKVKRVIVR